MSVHALERTEPAERILAHVKCMKEKVRGRGHLTLSSSNTGKCEALAILEELHSELANEASFLCNSETIRDHLADVCLAFLAAPSQTTIYPKNRYLLKQKWFSAVQHTNPAHEHGIILYISVHRNVPMEFQRGGCSTSIAILIGSCSLASNPCVSYSFKVCGTVQEVCVLNDFARILMIL